MRISDWSSDVCSADLCRGFSGCSCCWAIAGTAVDRHSNINAALQLCIMFLQPACGCELYMSHLRAKRVIFPLQRRLSGGVASRIFIMVNGAGEKAMVRTIAVFALDRKSTRPNSSH